MTNSELTSIRKSLNLSKTDFSKMIGIAPVVEGKYEKGSLEIPESVIQAVNILKNKMESESESVVEESISVVNDTLGNTLDSDTDKTVSEIYTVKDEDIITVNELVYEKNETITVEAKDNMIGIKDTITEGEINTSSVASDRVGIRRKYQKR